VVGVAVEFRLLGDVEAGIDGRLVGLGHPRQRCVLAVLLVDLNRPVSVDQLVDRVWGGQPPQRTSGTVYSYLSRLRQVLAAAAAVHLLRRPGGYVLAADPMTVDLHRFRPAGGGRPGRGPAGRRRRPVRPGAGAVAGRAVRGLGHRVAVRCPPHTAAAERLAAELDRNDLVLAQGRHAKLLPGLETRAAAYPLNERLAGQLMTALYRGGRQANVLGHFEWIRAARRGTRHRPLLRRCGAAPADPDR
jgi:DNA-binding SARP family transcriptional activator